MIARQSEQEVAVKITTPKALSILLVVITLNITGSWSLAQDGNELIREVRVSGNRDVATHEIMKLIRTRPGVPPDSKLLERDVRRVMETQQFADARVEYLREPHGLVVLFRVAEANRIKEIVIQGNHKLSDKYLKEKAGLETIRLLDTARALDAARLMEEAYFKKGYSFAKVKVTEGAAQGDTRLVFRVDEGPKVAVTDIDYVFIDTNTIGGRRLNTQIRTRQRRLIFGGQYNAREIDNDVYRLKNYYEGLGFFDSNVSREIEISSDQSKVKVIFIVSEGPRYSLRTLVVEGNEKLDDHEIADSLVVTENQFFNQEQVLADSQKIKDKYGAIGYVDAEVTPDIRFLEQPGLVDLIYKVKEGKQYYVGRIFVTGNDITKDSVVRRELRIYPGELLNTVRMRRSMRNLKSTAVFSSPGSQAAIIPVAAQSQPDGVGEGLASQGPNTRDGYGDIYKDVEVRVQEGQTGRLLFGLGVNSDAGLLGNIVLSEQNFDLFAWPRDFQDFLYGDTFRGGGQELRIEAAPGTQFSRYLVSLRQPRLFDRPWSLGVSGYYFSRFYREYDEQRGGGRITLGHAFSDITRATLGLRMENVEVRDVDRPTPPDILKAEGDNFLTSVSLGLEHDTRDSSFSPGCGHMLELLYEHGFGDFDFPKVTLDGRQFWTVKSRPDGSGRHIVSARGTLGFAGNDTPVFERFYAGGFRNFRGFRFRGVGPEVFNSKVGGEFMALGSVDYMLPITADDALNFVVFSDFGTVESDTTINDFRVTAGFGFRVQVSMLGPVPLAFDFAFPLNKTDFDDTQVFSFSVGLFR